MSDEQPTDDVIVAEGEVVDAAVEDADATVPDEADVVDADIAVAEGEAVDAAVEAADDAEGADTDADTDAGDADAIEVEGEAATEDEPPADELGAPNLSAALEALLLLADEPMSLVALAQATRRPVDEVEETVHALVADYDAAERGFELREVAGGWRYYTRASCSPLVERWVLDGQQARLTQASLETLAVIAYRQPVTRGRISAVRGVNVDGVIRTLVARGLIEEAGHDGEAGAILYRTTSTFLERLGISSLDELPPLAEHLPDLADLDDVLDDFSTGE